jgi:archaellum component FlaC
MDANNKNITLDDLAVMVSKGFNGVTDQFQGVNSRLDKIEGRLDKVEGGMNKLETEMQALRSSVNNYLELSDKRYLELKAREKVIVSWVKEIADKTGVKISLEDLEKAV